MASSFGGRRKWVHYKHIYWISHHVMFCEHTKKIIRRLTWSWNELNALQVVKSKWNFVLSKE